MFGYDANGYYGGSDDKITKTAILKIKSVTESLFYTATHKVQMWVGNVMITESDSVTMSPRDEDVKLWAQRHIGIHRVHLSWFGVDVNDEFTKFGGNIKDLHLY